MANRADNFNRSNGALDGSTPSDGLGTWQASTVRGNWQVLSNAANEAGSVPGTSIALDVGSDQQEVSIDLTTVAGSTSPALGVRMDATGYVNGIIAVMQGSGASNIAYKYENDGYTQLFTYTGTTWASGDTGGLRVDSADLFTVKKNGSTVTSSTQTGLYTGKTRAGMFGYSWGSTVWDNFAVTDLSGGAGGGIFMPGTHMGMGMGF